MSKFKVGEVVIIQCTSYPKYNGMETEILKIESGLSSDESLSYTADLMPEKRAGRTGRWGAKAFRKLPPKDTQSSWEEMKELFIPKGVEA